MKTNQAQKKVEEKRLQNTGTQLHMWPLRNVRKSYELKSFKKQQQNEKKKN